MLLNQTWPYTVLWKMLLKTDAALDQTFPCCFSSPQFAGLYLRKGLLGSRIKILVWKPCESPYKWNSLESQTNVGINITCAYLANKPHPVSMQSFTHLTRQKFRLVPICLLPALSPRRLPVPVAAVCWRWGWLGCLGHLVGASKLSCVYCSSFPPGKRGLELHCSHHRHVFLFFLNLSKFSH